MSVMTSVQGSGRPCRPRRRGLGLGVRPSPTSSPWPSSSSSPADPGNSGATSREGRGSVIAWHRVGRYGQCLLEFLNTRLHVRSLWGTWFSLRLSLGGWARPTVVVEPRFGQQCPFSRGFKSRSAFSVRPCRSSVSMPSFPALVPVGGAHPTGWQAFSMRAGIPRL